MQLDQIISRFVELTDDALVIGARRFDEPEARTVWCNKGFERLFGYSLLECFGRAVSFFHDPSDIKRFQSLLSKQFETQMKTVRSEALGKKSCGQTFWASVAVMPIPTDFGRLSVALFRDISALKQRELMAEAALDSLEDAHRARELVEARLLNAIEAMPTPVAIYDHADTLVVGNSAYSARVLGDATAARPGIHIRDVFRKSAYSGVIPDIEGYEEAWIEAAIKQVQSGHIKGVNKFPDGRIMQAEGHRLSNGDTIHWGADITDYVQAQKQLKQYAKQLENAHEISKHQALHDELTGLGNRRLLNKALVEMVERRARAQGEIYALHIDLCGFKTVNDTQGHATGDLLLRVVGDHLRLVTEAGHVLARIGGDEFAILVYAAPDGSAAKPETLAKSILELLAKPLDVDGSSVRIGASIGISSTEVSHHDNLLVDSDIALHKAKARGRNAFSYFSKTDLEEVSHKKQLSDDILRGLDAQEFIPFYQPQVETATGQVVGFEVLARWDHPQKGILLPFIFLDLAEELNVVERIDEMMFDAAIREMADFFDGDRAPALSFNVSHRRLLSDGLITDAKRSLSYPGGVSFELLETIFLDDKDTAAKVQIDTLIETGVNVEVDDFGSGHASIVALEQISPHQLKIDRRLIMPVTESERSNNLVRSIVQMGHSLDIGVTAEGVETADQAAWLASIGVDRLQGYYYGKPTSFDQIPALINDINTRSAVLKSA